MKVQTESRGLYSFLTSVLDGSGWLMPGPCSFSHGNDLVPSVQQAGWTAGLV